jgi:glycerol uptake facilitator-like aquaporin
MAHAMFGLLWWEPSLHERPGESQWLAEGVATFGLMLAIMGTRRYGTVTLSAAVATYICGAYWFTASTSFANPAVTLARSLTPTFAGMAPGGVPAFVLAQACGAVLAFAIAKLIIDAGNGS